MPDKLTGPSVLALARMVVSGLGSRIFWAGMALVVVLIGGLVAWSEATRPPPAAGSRIGHCYRVTGYSGKAGYMYSEIPCPLP